MTELAIKADGLGKKYKIGASVAQHDSIRDMLQSVGKKLLKPNKQKEAGEFWALRNASFEINRGENVGIIGLNGAGKSTLLKILSQIVTPTEGHATIQGRLGALLEVGTGFHQELTGRENVFLYGSILGMSREEVEQKFDRIVDFSEIADFIDTPVKRYSSGMYVRLAFAVAAHLDPDILLLDEVLAVGDFSFQKKCMDFAKSLEKQGSTILFVSHNMFSIKTMCPRVIYLKKGEVVFDGPTDEGLRIYEADSRLAQSPWFQSEGGQAPAITFTDIQLLDRSGTEKTVFEFGEQMTVRIRYQTSRPVQKPDIRIGINRADEIHCCSFSTSSDEIDLPLIDGEGEIEMVTPALELVSDQYTTTIAVRENDHQICSQLGATFHIRHPVYQSNAFGVFHQSGKWRLNGMKNGLPQTTVAKAK
jgi:lipopolysaccharide transport system ATP-binding protein